MERLSNRAVITIVGIIAVTIITIATGMFVGFDVVPGISEIQE